MNEVKRDLPSSQGGSQLQLQLLRHLAISPPTFNIQHTYIHILHHVLLRPREARIRCASTVLSLLYSSVLTSPLSTVIILIINAIAVLSEDRFLARSMSPSPVPLKTKPIDLIMDTIQLDGVVPNQMPLGRRRIARVSRRSRWI